MKKNFYAEYYEVEDKHWWFIGRRSVFLGFLDQHLDVANKEACQILDIGCGTGTMLKYLEAYGAPRGVDADEAAVQFCKMRGAQNVELLLGQTLPFEDATFDFVTIYDVLEHIDDDAGTLREIYRVLKPGGTVMISVPAYRFLWGPQDEISCHKRRYRAGELEERLTGAHFSIAKLSYFNAFLFPIIAGIRVARRLFGEPKELKSDFTMTKNGAVNNVLSAIFSAEARLLHYVNFPFGVSILALASKRSR